MACVDNTGIQHIASLYGGVGAGWDETFERSYRHALSAKLERHFLQKVILVFVTQLYRTTVIINLVLSYKFKCMNLFNLKKIYFGI